jgi:hypothetical protein
MAFSGFIKARERPRQAGGGHEKNETKGKKTKRTPGINRGKPEDEQKQEQGTYRTQGANDTHRRRKGGRTNTGEQKDRKK